MTASAELDPAAARYELSHLRALEAEAIHIIREVAAEFEKPVLLFSGGKDSIVMLHLAIKAFAPGRLPFPVMHVDTGHNFDEVLQIRDEMAAEHGVRWNLHVGVRYLEAWLGGSGAEPIHNLMEDLATSEISRSQLWQWLRFGAKLDDGRAITAEMYDALLAEELKAIRAEYGDARYDGGHFRDAVELFMRMSKSAQFDEFLSLPAYELLA